MIYIKLSVIHKAETVGLAVIFALIVVVVAMNASGNNTTPVSTTETHTDDTVVSETAATESYEPETQDESIDETTEVQAQTETTAEVEIETETTENVPVSQPTPVNIYYSEQDAFDIAKVLWNECRGVPSVTEQACVAWTVLNRVDKYNSTIHDVVRAPHQFAFSEGTTLDPVLIDIAYDVLNRWNAEKNGATDVGRVLPKEYTYFEGYGGHNHFRDAYSGDYNLWDYSLTSPYGS